MRRRKWEGLEGGDMGEAKTRERKNQSDLIHLKLKFKKKNIICQNIILKEKNKPNFLERKCISPSNNM